MTEDEKTSTERILEARVSVGSDGGQLKTGVWYDDFTAVKAEAEKTGQPLFAMWINPGCGFCKRFCTAATSEKFVTWMKASGIVFWLGSRTDGDAANNGREFVFEQSEDPSIEDGQRMYFPGIAVWQCEKGHPDKVLHDYRASGRVFEQEKSGDDGITNILARINQALTEPPHKVYVRKEPTREEMLERILSKDGPTRKLVALRQETRVPQLGVWHRNFRAVKNIADATGKPFIAMWTNGDLCGFCRRFTENILDQRFLDWMKTSDCYFWLGGSMDEENQRAGDGWKFFTDSGAVGYFPFVAVQHREHGNVTHQFFGAGHDFDQRKAAPDGTEPTIARIKEILSSAPQDLKAVKAENERKRREYEAKKAAGATHPHLSVLRQIAELVKPFSPVQAKWAQPELAIRMNTEIDRQKRNRIMEAIADNGGHCPCQKDKNASTLCLCDAFMSQAKPGPCICGLYEKYVRT